MTSTASATGAGARERVHGARQQALGDEAVEAADDDGESQSGGRKLAFKYFRHVSLSREGRLPFFQERAGTFATIFGGRADAECSGFELQAFVQAGIEADIHGFHDQPTATGPLASTLASQARL